MTAWCGYKALEKAIENVLSINALYREGEVRSYTPLAYTHETTLEDRFFELDYVY